MLSVIQRITPVLSNAAQVKINFHRDSALDHTTAAQRPEHIIHHALRTSIAFGYLLFRYLRSSAFICG